MNLHLLKPLAAVFFFSKYYLNRQKQFVEDYFQLKINAHLKLSWVFTVKLKQLHA